MSASAVPCRSARSRADAVSVIWLATAHCSRVSTALGRLSSRNATGVVGPRPQRAIPSARPTASRRTDSMSSRGSVSVQ